MNKKIAQFFHTYNLPLVLTALFISLTYFWMHVAHLFWKQRMALFSDNAFNFTINETAGAVAQALGLFLLVYLTYKKTNLALNNNIILAVMIANGCSIFPVSVSNTIMTTIILGVSLNFLSGFIIGHCVTVLSMHIPIEHRAGCYGIALILYNISSCFFPLTMNIEPLKLSSACLIYLILILIYIVLFFCSKNANYCSDKASDGPETSETTANLTNGAGNSFTSLYFLSGIAIFFLRMTVQFLFFSKHRFYLATDTYRFARVYYAIGLAIAAVINNKKRSNGLILALLSLCVPFLSLSFYRLRTLRVGISICNYIANGFLTIFTMSLFSDWYKANCKKIHLVPVGFICGNIGKFFGTVLSILTDDHRIALTVTRALLFMLSIIFIFGLYIRLYNHQPVTAPVASSRVDLFFAEFSFSVREQEVFLLIIEGKTNQEIAETLFISERTVKFHIHNILAKTNCQKRSEVVWKFQSYK